MTRKRYILKLSSKKIFQVHLELRYKNKYTFHIFIFLYDVLINYFIKKQHAHTNLWTNFSTVNVQADLF